MENQKLNANEETVLYACVNAIIKYSGCEFSPTSFVKSENITDNQMKGYLSQLNSKGFIKSWEADGNKNVSLTEMGCDYLLNITDDKVEIEQIKDIKKNI